MMDAMIETAPHNRVGIDFHGWKDNKTLRGKTLTRHHIIRTCSSRTYTRNVLYITVCGLSTAHLVALGKMLKMFPALKDLKFYTKSETINTLGRVCHHIKLVDALRLECLEDEEGLVSLARSYSNAEERTGHIYVEINYKNPKHDTSKLLPGFKILIAALEKRRHSKGLEIFYSTKRPWRTQNALEKLKNADYVNWCLAKDRKTYKPSIPMAFIS